jgi:hypothetical protein
MSKKKYLFGVVFVVDVVAVDDVVVMLRSSKIISTKLFSGFYGQK